MPPYCFSCVLIGPVCLASVDGGRLAVVGCHSFAILFVVALAVITRISRRSPASVIFCSFYPYFSAKLSSTFLVKILRVFPRTFTCFLPCYAVNFCSSSGTLAVWQFAVPLGPLGSSRQKVGDIVGDCFERSYVIVAGLSIVFCLARSRSSPFGISEPLFGVQTPCFFRYSLAG